jgi:hypothetical protein
MAEAKGRPKDADTPGSKQGESKSTQAGETQQLVLTLSVATGEIVNVEKIDPSGQRRELTEDEYADLAVDDVADELEATLEDAYETGVVDALGEGSEELALRRVVAGRLLARGMLRDDLGRQLLRRAIRNQMLKRGPAAPAARSGRR